RTIHQDSVLAQVGGGALGEIGPALAGVVGTPQVVPAQPDMTGLRRERTAGGSGHARVERNGDRGAGIGNGRKRDRARGLEREESAATCGAYGGHSAPEVAGKRETAGAEPTELETAVGGGQQRL